MTTFVHWEEGLFLQPHHFQMMQRQATLQSHADRELSWAYPYGLLEARLSTDALHNRQIQFDRLRAVMPSGIVVDVPRNAELPVLSIEEHLKRSADPITILLAVPLWQKDRANVIESNGELKAATSEVRAKRLFRASSIDAPDENTGKNERQIRIRRINAMLLTDADETSDLDVIPLLRVVPGVGREGAPRLDESFIPPCMALAGWPILHQFARDIANMIESFRRDTARLVRKDGVSMENLRGRQFEMILRLRTLNRFTAVVPRMVSQAATTPPFDLYVRLCELIGELAALFPDRDAFAAPEYDHAGLWPLFHDLKQRIKDLGAPPGAEETMMHVEFAREQHRFVADLNEQHATLPNEYFLALRTREDPRTVQTLLEDGVKTKLMALSKSGAKIYGVPLEREINPPMQFPADAGLHYFRLRIDKNPRRWEEIVAERKMVLEGGVMGHDDFKFTLYMTVPGAGGN